MGKYFADDTEFRQRYFEQQFLRWANAKSGKLKIVLSGYLSDILDKESFFKKLQDSVRPNVRIKFEGDASLFDYFSNMTEEDVTAFFERKKIQDIVDNNKSIETTTGEERQSNIEEFEKKLEKLDIPDAVVQSKRRPQNLFIGTVSGKRFLLRKTFVKVRGKRQIRYRDSLGRFGRRT